MGNWCVINISIRKARNEKEMGVSPRMRDLLSFEKQGLGLGIDSAKFAFSVGTVYNVKLKCYLKPCSVRSLCGVQRSPLLL